MAAQEHIPPLAQTPGLAIAKLLLVTVLTVCASFVFFMFAGEMFFAFVLLHIVVLCLQVCRPSMQWRGLLSFAYPFVLGLLVLIVRGTSAYDIVYALGFTGAMATVGLAVAMPVLDYIAKRPHLKSEKLTAKTVVKNGEVLVASLGFAVVFATHWQLAYPEYVESVGGTLGGLLFLGLTLWSVVTSAREVSKTYMQHASTLTKT